MNGDGGGAARRRALLRRVVLRGAEACAAVMDAVVRWTGPVLSVVVVLLIGTLTQVYLMELLPAAREEMGDARAAAWTAAGLYLVAGISYHYYRVSVRGPGHPPRELPRAVLRALADDPQLNPAALATDPTTRRFCKHCRAVKPMRTHHCSVCRRCVLKMDHHCPWMNNCVGHDNLRHFYLFLVYAMFGCALFLRVGWTRVRPALRAKSEEPVHFLLCVVAAAAVFLAAGLFVAWNTFLLARNQTTIEFYGSSCGGDRRPRNTVHANPYYLGVAANLRQVFGSGLVVLWPWAAPPPGDGLTFPVLPGRPFSYHATTLEEILVDPEPAEGRRRAT